MGKRPLVELGNPPKQKKAPKTVVKTPRGSAEDAQLEAFLFGSGIPKVEKEPEVVEEDEDDDEQEPEEQSSRKTQKGKKKRNNKSAAARKKTAEAAWEDPDDATLQVDLNSQNRLKKLRTDDEEKLVDGKEYERRLRQQFKTIHGSVAWSQKQKALEPSDSEDEVVATSGSRVVKDGSRLSPKEINVVRLNDKSTANVSKAVMQSVKFHPNSELLLTAGLDKTLRLFAIDGDENPRLSSKHIEGFPISSASFTPDGGKAVLTGITRKLFVFDVTTGECLGVPNIGGRPDRRYWGLAVGPHPKDAPSLVGSKSFAMLSDNGYVLVCDVATRQLVRTFKMNADARVAVFSPQRNILYSADDEAFIYEWDLGTGRCVQRKKDEWAIQIWSMALNPTKPVMAVGTSSGTIDLLDISGPSLPSQPFKSIDNLTTTVTSLQFHGKGEVLLGASKWKKNSMRMAHSGTWTVFPNWPTKQSPLGYVTAMDFSRNSGMLAIGNQKGKVLLYRLQHYS
eukprot:gnl/MRDRNA2_/MRDRNA2_106099_c0_seq1.p1 gnl/MRDRNA2_/MRDRNA2_106099_c0~~gnl/MRDRNA2_/MRDRNA2_106099_c0_seq1.p1  ORF type:complete len:508 (+),score=108.87 gnl/MRDRNA2_/MRDRNA2_106099_c0_seq1:92-1615(+)